MRVNSRKALCFDGVFFRRVIDFVNQMVYNSINNVVLPNGWRKNMRTSDMIKELCNRSNISISELARRIGQTPQNFGKKLKRDTVSLDELKKIADVMDVTFEQAFVFPDGECIKQVTSRKE